MVVVVLMLHERRSVWAMRAQEDCSAVGRECGAWEEELRSSGSAGTVGEWRVRVGSYDLG